MLTWIEAHPGLAAWLQGIGTLVALAITVWATIHATATTKRLALRQTNAILDQIEGITLGLSNSLMIGSPVSPETAKAMLEAYADIGTQGEITRLLELPLTAWPDLTLHAAVQKVAEVAGARRDALDYSISRARRRRGGEAVESWDDIAQSLCHSAADLDAEGGWLVHCAIETAVDVQSMSRRRARKRFKSAWRPNAKVVHSEAFYD